MENTVEVGDNCLEVAWSKWSEWGDCADGEGVKTYCGGSQIRERHCNPAGHECVGESSETRACLACPEWTAWSTCDNNCNGYKTRECKGSDNTLYSDKDCPADQFGFTSGAPCGSLCEDQLCHRDVASLRFKINGFDGYTCENLLIFLKSENTDDGLWISDVNGRGNGWDCKTDECEKVWCTDPNEFPDSYAPYYS